MAVFALGYARLPPKEGTVYDAFVGLAFVALALYVIAMALNQACRSCRYNTVFLGMGNYRRRDILVQLHLASLQLYEHPCS